MQKYIILVVVTLAVTYVSLYISALILAKVTDYFHESIDSLMHGDVSGIPIFLMISCIPYFVGVIGGTLVALYISKKYRIGLTGTFVILGLILILLIIFPVMTELFKIIKSHS